MLSFFPRALLFKEWHQYRWYLLIGMLFMSLSPALHVTQLHSSPIRYLQQLVDDNTLPILEWLLPVYGAGLAYLALRDVLRADGSPSANEPVSQKAVLRTKFFMGVAVIVTTQTVVVGWFGWSMQALPISFPLMEIFGYWIVLVMGALACFTLAFAFLTTLRPVGAALFSMCLVLFAPYMVDNWLQRIWIHWMPDGSMYAAPPFWAGHVSVVLLNLTPLATARMLPSDLISHKSPYFFEHNLLPFVWVILGYPALAVFGHRRPVHVFESSVDYRKIRLLARGVLSLFAASVEQFYLLGYQGETQLWVKVVQLVVLWLCTHLLLRAILSGEGVGLRRRRNLKEVRR